MTAMDIDSTTMVMVIKIAVAAESRVTVLEIDSTDRRGRKVSAARHLAQYLVRTNTTLSYPRIGVLFNADPSSVRYAMKKMAVVLKTNSSLANLCAAISSRINCMKG